MGSGGSSPARARVLCVSVGVFAGPSRPRAMALVDIEGTDAVVRERQSIRAGVCFRGVLVYIQATVEENVVGDG